MTKIILGSQSPRRQEILRSLSLPFIQETSFFDEDAVPFTGDPEKYVITIAEGKAAALAKKFPDSLILTADTTVFYEGKVYGKATSEEQAYETLREFSGKWQSVYTGVTLRNKEKVLSKAEVTRVLCNPLTPEQIRTYLKRINWKDRAGSYTIQLEGGIAVRKIDGCYYNVIGLPVNTVEELLKEFGITLF